MWKKQWNKLKTALGDPQEYIEEESEEEVAEEIEYRTDPIINVQYEDFIPIAESMQTADNIKKAAGEMFLRHEKERAQILQLDVQINNKIQEQIVGLRTTYNVDPSTDYQLDFPQVEGEAGAFVRLSSEGEE